MKKKNPGELNITQAKIPPKIELVFNKQIAIKSCDEVGPGIDWQIVVS